MKPKRSSAQGFTLVELLVVIAIAAIVAVLSIGAYQQIIKSSVLTGAAQTLTGALDQARQMAITRNEQVEVRLYQLPAYNSDASGSPTSYRALQVFLISDTGTFSPLTKVIFLPPPIVMQSSASNSTLVGGADVNGNLATSTGSSLNQPIPGFQNNYNCISFRFSPKGGLNLSTTQQWYVTLVSANDKLKGNGFPSNYATVQIDPFTGRTRFFRP